MATCNWRGGSKLSCSRVGRRTKNSKICPSRSAQPAIAIAERPDCKSLCQILDVSDCLTAKIFTMLNALAVQAIIAGHERITDDAVSQWSPVIGPEVTYS